MASEVTTRSFPYPIHKAAVLGDGVEELDEAVVQDLVDRIATFGYSESEPIVLYRGSVLDGRHRQEACVRLGIEPPVVKADLRGMTPYEWVLNRHHLRPISDKARAVFAIENFPNEGPAKLKRRLGECKVDLAALRAIYKKATTKQWNSFKAGKISQKALAQKLGLHSGGWDYNKDTREQLKSKEQELTALSGDLEMYQADLERKEERIKALEKRIRQLDPKERLDRLASGETTVEDQLRDRVEFLEDELKRAEKVNEKLATKEKEIVRIQNVVQDVLAGQDLTVRGLRVPLLDPGKRSRPHEFVALMSDAHYGEVVNPSEALGIAYDPDIAVRRIEHYRDVVISYKNLRDPAYDISKLTVVVLGDMMSGNIHAELANTNAMTITEQTSNMARILRDIALDFASEFAEVEFVVMPGNHPRVWQKPQNKKKFDNYEHIMGVMLQEIIAASQIPNVTVTVPTDLFYVHNVFDQRIGMFHGDGVKSNSFAGIPFYGMRQRREAVQSLMNSRGLDRLDMLLMGHFHQYLYWEAECSILINGAIKGGDEYSISTFMSAPDPVQVLLEFHPEHGLTAQERINFAHIN